MNDTTKKALNRADKALTDARSYFRVVTNSDKVEIRKIDLIELGQVIKELSTLLEEQCKTTEKYFKMVAEQKAKEIKL